MFGSEEAKSRTVALFNKSENVLHLHFLVNVVQNKPAWQSSAESEATAADRATDGNPDPKRAIGSCAVTTNGQNSSAWWLVDLAREYVIQEVAVVNIADDQGACRLSYRVSDANKSTRHRRFHKSSLCLN